MSLKVSAGYTHWLEPSPVFLPSLTNRLFGEAAERLGGRGGRGCSSSEDPFISFIPGWCLSAYARSVPAAADVIWSHRERPCPVPSGRRDDPSRTSCREPLSCCCAFRNSRCRCFQPSASCWSRCRWAGQSNKGGSSYSFSPRNSVGQSAKMRTLSL